MVSLLMEFENKNVKTECVNENENKENKNVDEFHESILQQRPPNRKIKHKVTQRHGSNFIYEKTRRGNCVTYYYLFLLRICCCANLSKL